MTATREQIRATLTLLFEIAQIVCDEYKKTGQPIPQGPMYGALMGRLTLGDFQALMNSLKHQGFIVTGETIAPGPEIEKLLPERKEQRRDQS